MNLIETEIRSPIIGIILAGGAGRRLGGIDKGLVNLRGQPLIEHVLARLEPQVDQILIVANRHLDSYSAYEHTVIQDSRPGFEGPLCGMLSGLGWAHSEHGPAKCLFVPVDAPLLPEDLCSRLTTAAGDGTLAVASNAEGRQPVCSLIGTENLPSMEQAYNEGLRSPSKWLNNCNAPVAEFSNSPATVWSLNTPEELKQAEQILLAHSGQAA